MITGKSDETDVVHALESGADDCIGKPFGEPELRARLLVASRILALQNELIQAREELRVQAMRDGLTGLWNRGAFLDLFKRELERAERSHGRTGLLLLDLDNFKRINDTYGHIAGDLVLRVTGRFLRQSVRSYDFVADTRGLGVGYPRSRGCGALQGQGCGTQSRRVLRKPWREILRIALSHRDRCAECDPKCTMACAISI